ncbi:MAG TPA: PAS domain S-box protein [Myxococcota bacterium]|nr:PAS domain S-box protein [Myxococcota bacterium]
MAAIADPRREFEAAAGVLLDAIDIIALVLDPAGRVVLANRACEAVLGMSAAKMLGRTPLELGFAPPEACPDEATGDVQVCDPAGRVRLVAWSSRVLFEADGAVRCVVATGSDVTEARANEKRLRESERRFRELAENVNDLVAELSGEGVFTYVNPRFETSLGFPPEHYLGHSLYTQLHPADQDDVRRAMAELSEPGEARQSVMRLLRSEGGYCTLESVARAFPAPGGTLRLAVIARDLSERTAAEAELRRADRLVTLGTFAAGVAHEINNPMGAILLGSEIALEREREKAPQSHAAQALKRIADHARRCGAIVGSMLAFAAQGRNERRPHDVNELVQHAAALVQGYARERGARLRLCCAANLPPILCNGVEIEQVFVNLLRNAVEAGRAPLSIEIATERTAHGVCARVRDDGDGIPEDRRDRVFEAFFSTKGSSGGTGLGLAIARRIVADHGGEIRLEGSASGTCFAVELPCAERSAS